MKSLPTLSMDLYICIFLIKFMDLEKVLNNTQLINRDSWLVKTFSRSYSITIILIRSWCPGLGLSIRSWCPELGLSIRSWCPGLGLSIRSWCPELGLSIRSWCPELGLSITCPPHLALSIDSPFFYLLF